MGNYQFDAFVERRNTDCIKFDLAARRGLPEGTLSYWVADMDFETVPEIAEAIRERTRHNIYGYSMTGDGYYDAVIGWMRKRHGWETKKEWYFYTPGVVFAIGMAVRALTEEGDSVLIQRPVYYPFGMMIEKNGRRIVNSPLIQAEDGRYHMDFEDFERKVVSEHVKLFILCNPHNPVGRVWTKEELLRVGEICVRHGVFVVSDEIHADFVWSGHHHEVFAALKPEFADFTVTCTAPSKTFNLAGLQLSNIIASNRELRERVKQEIDKTGYDEPNLFGSIACEAAYRYGETWLEELREYLEGNLTWFGEYLEENLPRIRYRKPEGTYLAWLDFREYGLTGESLDQKILNEAGLWLDGGTMFGEEGEGFQRFNLAASRPYLEKGLKQLRKVFGRG